VKKSEMAKYLEETQRCKLMKGFEKALKIGLRYPARPRMNIPTTITDTVMINMLLRENRFILSH
jgi:hypothetical protein